MNATTLRAATTARETSHPVDPLFLNRWSPRAFDGSAIPRADLLTLFEAARWAPSAFNYQPWRFLVALNGQRHWDKFLHSLVPFNRDWAQNASALSFVLSDSLFDTGKTEGPAKSRTASFDAGAAWSSLAFQAARLGYSTRAMAGFDHDYAREALRIPEQFNIEAAIAIGTIATADAVPPHLQGREVPTGRRHLAETVFEGPFGSPTLTA